MASDRAVILRRVGLGLLAAGAVWFAVQGGEFSTIDLLRQRTQKSRLTESVDSLQRVVDSLRKYEDRVRRDPKTQERIAREVFGMVRGDKEVLYRFAAPRDSTGRDSTGGERSRKVP